jgi:hypothetical protein
MLIKNVFNPGPPPPGWLEPSQLLKHKARIVSLWNTTVGLIHDERLLQADPNRFLAMIGDHKVSPNCQTITRSDTSSFFSERV